MDLQSRIKESKRKKVKLTLEEFEDIVLECIKEGRNERDEAEEQLDEVIKRLKDVIKLYNNFYLDKEIYELSPWYDKEEGSAGYTKKGKKHVGF